MLQVFPGCRHIAVSLMVTVLTTLLSTAQTPSPKIRPPLTATAIAKKALASTFVVVNIDSRGDEQALGSGFVVDHGFIATNYHVVDGATNVAVKKVIGDRRYYAAIVEWVDEENDLAILSLKADIRRTPLPLAKNSRVEVGSTVYAAGNPKGFEGTFSNGIVSGIRKSGHIQITAAISPGSSGGPVFNQFGEVIGVATLTYLNGQNLNFAVPVSHLSELLNMAKADEIDRFLAAQPSRTQKQSSPARTEKGGFDPDSFMKERNEIRDMVQQGANHYDKQEYHAAIAVLKKAIAADASNAEAYFQLGRSYLGLNNTDEGFACLRRAHRMKPDDAYYRYILGFEYATQKVESAAIDECRILKSLDLRYYQSLAEHICSRGFDSTAALNFCAGR